MIRAEQLQNINSDEWDIACIEEYDTDDDKSIGWFKHRYVFRFNIKNNEYEYIHIYDGCTYKDDWLMAKDDERKGIKIERGHYYHYVCVESNKPLSVVKKIAQDRYAEWKATQEGLS